MPLGVAAAAMSFRKVSRLPIDSEIKEKIARASLKTVMDVLSLAPVEVMNQLQLSSHECQGLLDQLYTYCLPHHTTAWELSQGGGGLATRLGGATLDTLLHGGIQPGTLTEFTGPAGVGKTQWCLQVAVEAVVGSRRRGTHHAAIYVDTEAAFRPERVAEIICNKYPEYEAEVSDILAKIYLYQPETVDSLSQVLEWVQVVAVEREACVLLVDSVASLVRKEMVAGAAHVNITRAAQVAVWAATMKSIAQQLNICVVVSNQVTSGLWDSHPTTMSLHSSPQPPSSSVETSTAMPEEGERVSSLAVTPALDHTCTTQEEDHKFGSPEPYGCEKGERGCGPVVTPALGNTWTHCVNTRFILQYTHSHNVRQLLIAKSPVAPFSIFNYTIGEGGITVREEDNVYLYSGSDPGQHKIKVHTGLTL